MRMFQRVRKTSLFLSLSLIIAFALLLHVNFARAEEGLDPNGGFEQVVLLQGQSTGSIGTSAVAAFDVFSIGVVSIGNKTLTASLSITSDHTGFWWLTLIGTGGRTWFGFSFGIAPWSGSNTQVDINDSGISYGLATGGIISTSPVTSEDPLRYSISVTGG